MRKSLNTINVVGNDYTNKSLETSKYLGKKPPKLALSAYLNNSSPLILTPQTYDDEDNNENNTNNNNTNVSRNATASIFKDARRHIEENKLNKSKF